MNHEQMECELSGKIMCSMIDNNNNKIIKNQKSNINK